MIDNKVYNISEIKKAFDELKCGKSTERRMTIEFRKKRYNVIISLANPMYKYNDFMINHNFYTADETSKIKPSEYILALTPKNTISVYNMSAKPIDKVFSWGEEWDLKRIITESSHMECIDGDLSNMRMMDEQDYYQNFESAEEFLKKKHKKKYENYIARQNKNKVLDSFIKPSLTEAFIQMGLQYIGSNNKLYVDDNVWAEKIEKFIINELQPILKQYNISFKSNLKNLSITRSIGEIKFNEVMKTLTNNKGE